MATHEMMNDSMTVGFEAEGAWSQPNVVNTTMCIISDNK